MKYTSLLKAYEAEDVRRLRKNFPELRFYLDHEIAHCFAMYCEMFHCASWTKVVDADFVKWATTAPLDDLKGEQSKGAT